MHVFATSLVLLREDKELIFAVGPSEITARFDDVPDALVTQGS